MPIRNNTIKHLYMMNDLDGHKSHLCVPPRAPSFIEIAFYLVSCQISNMDPIRRSESNSSTVIENLRLPDSLVQGGLVKENELVSLLDELSHPGRRPDEL